jgi:hypothetical protein
VWFRNSWGYWGQAGNGRLPWGYPGMFDDAWGSFDRPDYDDGVIKIVQPLLTA